MASKICEQCKVSIVPQIEKMGYEVVELSYGKSYGGNELNFVLDCDSGITIEDCEKVHKVIGPMLDELNLIEETYTLNVCSPGIDRPIKTLRDAKRNMDKEVEIHLYKKIDEKKDFVGKLIGFSENEVVIESGSNNIAFSRLDVAQIKPVIKF